MSCTKPIGNTGVTSCLPSDEVISGLIFQATESSTGTENSLLGASMDTATYLTAQTQILDESIRLVPIQNVVEVIDERGEDEFYSDDSKAEHFLQAGQRIFNGEIIVNASPQLYGELIKWKDTQASVYHIGKEGGIFGDESGTEDLIGFEIVRGTMSFAYLRATRAKPAHIKIKFTYDESVVDENIRKYSVDEIEDNAKKLTGLIASEGAISGTVTTSVYTVDIYAVYGTALSKEAIEGLLAADMVMTEISPTPGTTSISSILESSTIPGRYAITVTTTSGDVNELTLSQTGHTKGYTLSAVTVTTP